MAFLGLKYFMVPWRGVGAGKWLPAAEPRASTFLVLQPCLSSSWDLWLGFQVLGLVCENKLGYLSSFGLHLPNSPGLELNFLCNAWKCQCWDGSPSEPCA